MLDFRSHPIFLINFTALNRNKLEFILFSQNKTVFSIFKPNLFSRITIEFVITIKSTYNVLKVFCLKVNEISNNRCWANFNVTIKEKLLIRSYKCEDITLIKSWLAFPVDVALLLYFIVYNNKIQAWLYYRVNIMKLDSVFDFFHTSF